LCAVSSFIGDVRRPVFFATPVRTGARGEEVS
jgi:hypothetical protein